MRRVWRQGATPARPKWLGVGVGVGMRRPRTRWSLRFGHRVAAVGVAIALGAWAVAIPPPGLVRSLGGAVPVRYGTMDVSVAAGSVFFRPGSAVVAPAAGVLTYIHPAGPVQPGVVLAVLRPSLAGPVVARTEQPLAALVCAWTACDATWGAAVIAQPLPRAGIGPLRSDPARTAPVRSPVVVTATAAGWFFPGWDPLSALPPAALPALPPRALVAAAPTQPRLAQFWPAGQALGVLGQAWSGEWIAAVPAADSPAPGSSLQVTAPTIGTVPGTVMAVGAACDGLRLVAVASTALLPDSAPPGPGVNLAWRTPRVPLVPVGSLRVLQACAALGQGGTGRGHLAEWTTGHRPHWTTVDVTAEMGGTVALGTAPPPGSSVLLRATWFPFWVG